eukprot:9448023-Heterocapsa_arctica.AAC.1
MLKSRVFRPMKNNCHQHHLLHRGARGWGTDAWEEPLYARVRVCESSAHRRGPTTCPAPVRCPQ